ncbi:hypothetical protein C8256_08630 [Kluyvera genomosp. 2]|uniref:Uncharacterized protein n=2 Tax=Enterobacterales TaxID=91347 RepID=A0A2T2Y3T4_9ENTR|nr:hypothetical protein C8256_08630 [Kluyvera genomosp. 2]
MRTELKIEKKMRDEFELKREEEKQQKMLQKYEELLAMEIEWHTQRLASIHFFLAKIKKKQDAEYRSTHPSINGDNTQLHSRIKALIFIYFPHLQDDYAKLCKLADCTVYFDYVYGRSNDSARVIRELSDKMQKFAALSTEFQNRIRNEVTVK